MNLRTLAIIPSLALALSSGCKRKRDDAASVTPSVTPVQPMMPGQALPVAPMQPTMPAQALPVAPMQPMMGGGETCMTARVITLPTVITGDLSLARDDVNERIERSGYAWEGRDHFFAVFLQAGQTIQIRLNDSINPANHFDGGVYVFTDCANVNASTLAGLDTSANGPPLVFTAPAPGRYVIAVDAWIENTGGAYQLTVM